MNLSFLKYVKDGFKIADIGCGPNGAIWWDQIQGCTINAFDLYFKPPSFERGGNKISFEKRMLVIRIIFPNIMKNLTSSYVIISLSM